MNADDFRRIALGFPQTCESAHMGHPDFRVRGKIFATLWPDQGWGMVKLTPEEQRQFVQASSETFAPINGGWGKRGATRVCLEGADETLVQSAMHVAWRSVAPKRLVERFEAGD